MSDVISRQEAIDALKRKQDDGKGDLSRFYNTIIQHDIEAIMQLPPIQPKRGKCKWCERLKERNLRIEYYWIDEEGCTASFSEPHIVATGIAKFCPNCGAKLTEGDAE